MSYYKDDFTDFIMYHNDTSPRYRALAIKALKFYLGDLYNPKTLDPNVELQIREFIYTCIHIRVINRIPYHWEFIDNYLRRLLYQSGFEHLEYNNALIEQRYHNGKYDPPKGIFDMLN